MASGTGFWFLASDSALAADLSAALSLVLLPQPAASSASTSSAATGNRSGLRKQGHRRDIVPTAAPRWPRLRPAGWTEAQSLRPSGRSTGRNMAPRIVRPVFALLVLGLAVHAAHALIGPGDGAAGPRHRQLGLHRRDVDRRARCACWPPPSRRRERGAWALIGLGLLLWSGGDLVWTLWLTDLENPPYPSVADGLYLGSYIAIYAGLLLLLRARLRPIRPAQWLDGAVGGLAAAAVVAALVFPALAGHHRGRHDRRRLQPRLSGLRRPAAHAHRHGLRPEPLARGPLVAAARPRAARQRRRRFGLQLPVGRGHLRRGLVGRHAVARGRHAHRGRRVAARAAPDGRGGRRPHAVVDRGLRRHRARRPRHRPVHDRAPRPRRCWPPRRCSSPAPAAACSSARTCACCARAATSRSPTASPGWPTAAR